MDKIKPHICDHKSQVKLFTAIVTLEAGYAISSGTTGSNILNIDSSK